MLDLSVYPNILNSKVPFNWGGWKTVKDKCLFFNKHKSHWRYLNFLLSITRWTSLLMVTRNFFVCFYWVIIFYVYAAFLWMRLLRMPTKEKLSSKYKYIVLGQQKMWQVTFSLGAVFYLFCSKKWIYYCGRELLNIFCACKSDLWVP